MKVTSSSSLIRFGEQWFKFQFGACLRTRSCFRGMMTTKKLRIDLSGIFPPIPTPFKENEEIDYEGLERNFNVWNKINFAGYVVQGSNGEYVYLSKEERIEVVKWARMKTPNNKLIIAGSGCESTSETVRLSQEMEKVGADALLVVTPSYYKNGMTHDALYEHYVKVADNSTIPVILYSVPSNTGIDLDRNLVARLAKHPNIVGLKDSGGDIVKISDMVRMTCDEDFQILAGSSSFLYSAIALGCVGGVCALANVLGREVCQLHELIKEGQHEQAKLLQQRLVPPNTMVTRRFGVPGLKSAMNHFGLKGGFTRRPLRQLSGVEEDECLRSFKDNLFLPTK